MEERRSWTSTVPLRRKVIKERSASTRREARRWMFKEDRIDKYSWGRKAM